MTSLRASGLVASLLLAACAAQPSPQTAAPSYPSSSYNQPNAQGYQQPTAYPAPTYAQPPPPPPASTSVPGSGSAGLPGPGGVPGLKEDEPKTMGEAVTRFEKEAKQLQTGLANCELACKALGSMERAVRVVCDLARGDERPRCDDARSRLREARTRVRNACGECQGGPRTDADAPDP